MNNSGRCPICNQLFSMKMLLQHAPDCTGIDLRATHTSLFRKTFDYQDSELQAAIQNSLREQSLDDSHTFPHYNTEDTPHNTEDVPHYNTAEDVPHYNTADNVPHYNTADNVPHYNTADNVPHYNTAEDVPHYNTADDVPHYNTAEDVPHYNTAEDNPHHKVKTNSNNFQEAYEDPVQNLIEPEKKNQSTPEKSTLPQKDMNRNSIDNSTLSLELLTADECGFASLQEIDFDHILYKVTTTESHHPLSNKGHLLPLGAFPEIQFPKNVFLDILAEGNGGWFIAKFGSIIGLVPKLKVKKIETEQALFSETQILNFVDKSWQNNSTILRSSSSTNSTKFSATEYSSTLGGGGYQPAEILGRSAMYKATDAPKEQIKSDSMSRGYGALGSDSGYEGAVETASQIERPYKGPRFSINRTFGNSSDLNIQLNQGGTLRLTGSGNSDEERLDEDQTNTTTNSPAFIYKSVLPEEKLEKQAYKLENQAYKLENQAYKLEGANEDQAYLLIPNGGKKTAQAMLSKSEALPPPPPPPPQLNHWNTRFQALRAKMDFDALIGLSKDFVAAATMYGRIIISEKFLPEHEKTIQPSQLGGIAGGDKFRVHGILFKFPRDLELETGVWLYGGSKPSISKANKAAGHELRGLEGIFQANIANLSVTLTCLIDYAGFRLFAQALLPISGPDSLVYGSCDGALTLKDGSDDLELKEKIQQLAQKLKLQSHAVMEKSTEKMKTLCTAADVEIHRGHDGHYYAIDLARMYPPQFPEGPPPHQQIYTEHFRPEFLAHHYHKRLSSDVFSGFSRFHREPLEKDAHDATEYLKNNLIPLFAANLTEDMTNSLIRYLHAAGINIRFLGEVRRHCASEKFKNLILLEMCARSIKKILETRLRETLQRASLFETHELRKTASDLYNFALMEDFWSSTSTLKEKILEKFGENALTLNEKQTGESILKFPIGKLFFKLEEISCITIGPEALQSLGTMQNDQLSYHTDFFSANNLDLAPKVKQMNLVEKSVDQLRLAQANLQPLSTKIREYQDVEKKFRSTAQVKSNDAQSQIEWLSVVLPTVNLLRQHVKVPEKSRADAAKLVNGVVSRDTWPDSPQITELWWKIVEAYFRAPRWDQPHVLDKAILLQIFSQPWPENTKLNNEFLDYLFSRAINFQFQVGIHSPLALCLAAENYRMLKEDFHKWLQLEQKNALLCLADVEKLKQSTPATLKVITDHIDSIRTFASEEIQKVYQIPVNDPLCRDSLLYLLPLLQPEHITLRDWRDEDMAIIPQKVCSLTFNTCKQLTGNAFQFLPKFTKLESVSFYHTPQITDEDLEPIQKMFSTQFCNLDFSYCANLTMRFFTFLLTATNLRKLIMKSCTATDLTIEALSSCPSVANNTFVHLSLENSREVTEKSAPYFSKLHSLECLVLTNCTHIGDKIIQAICANKNMTKLSKLYLDYTQVGDHSLFAIATKSSPLCNSLVDLYLTGTSISSRGLTRLLKNCPNLLTLDASKCTKISDKAFSIKTTSTVQHLILDETSQTDELGKHLALYFPRLSVLSLKSTKTSIVVISYLLKGPAAETISKVSIPGISDTLPIKDLIAQAKEEALNSSMEFPEKDKKGFLSLRKGSISSEQRSPESQSLRLKKSLDDISKPQDFVCLCKVLLLGATKSGKSSIIERAIFNSFTLPAKEIPLSGNKPFSLETGKGVVQLEIWDGGAIPAQLINAYIRGAQVIILVFDSSDQESFDCVLNYLIQVKKCGNTKTLMFLCGTKADLQEEVSSSEARIFMERHSLAEYFQISSKLNMNVMSMFLDISRKYIDYATNLIEKDSTTPTSGDRRGLKKKNWLFF